MTKCTPTHFQYKYVSISHPINANSVQLASYVHHRPAHFNEFPLSLIPLALI